MCAILEIASNHSYQRFIFFSAIIIALFALIQTINPLYAISSPLEKWPVYRNTRFQYQICFPKFMIPQGESANSDGQTFIAEDGGKLIVYGSYSKSVLYNGDFLKTIKTSIRNSIGKNGHITYQTYHRKWAVISGTDSQGYIFYSKFINGKDGLTITFYLKYTKSLEHKYNAIPKKLISCFTDISP